MSVKTNRYNSSWRAENKRSYRGIEYDLREVASGWVVVAEIGEFKGQSVTDAMNKFRAEVERHFKEDR
jgi:hypothetical protein